jgi:8-amino-7-oxononanoate synthase
MPSEAQKKTLAEMASVLAELGKANQLRSLERFEGVNFCSNDYLGLAEDSRLKQAVLDAVEKAARIGGTGSRLLSGHDPAWNELEEEFAEFAGTESAIYFPSGYAAILGMLTAVLRKEDLVFSDALNHASLIDGIRMSGARRVIFPHLDLNALEQNLRAREHESCRKVIVTESVFSMDGDLADLKAIQNLAARFGATLIIDEAHATGVHGPGGAGLVAQAGLTSEVLAVMHACGKALASAGGFVCGPKPLREYLINHARTLIFSTAMPVYMAGQIGAALTLAKRMDRERETLLGNSHFLANWLRVDGWNVSRAESQIIPVIVGTNEDAMDAANFLQKRGFAIRAIRPPTVPEGSARLRLSLTARIPLNELQRLRDCLKAWRASKENLNLLAVAARRR